jgi:hypothetical protein
MSHPSRSSRSTSWRKDLIEKDSKRAMATKSSKEAVPAGIDPDDSPFELQAIEGLPFDEDSDEAKAIREVIEQAELERAAASSRISR